MKRDLSPIYLRRFFFSTFFFPLLSPKYTNVRGLSIHTNGAFREKKLSIHPQINAFKHEKILARRRFVMVDSWNHTSVIWIFIRRRLCAANSISRNLKIYREVLRAGFRRLNVGKILLDCRLVARIFPCLSAFFPPRTPTPKINKNYVTAARWACTGWVYICEFSRSTTEVVMKLFACRVLVRQRHIRPPRHSLEKTMKRDLTTMRKRQDEGKRDRGITRYRFLFACGIRGGLRLRKSYAEMRASWSLRWKLAHSRARI